jgi:hypothetical protein
MGRMMENLDKRTRSQRWSDNIAEFCGSWGFVERDRENVNGIHAKLDKLLEKK